MANTFPPEIWHRIVVIAWSRLPEAEQLDEALPSTAVGLALEHRLQDRLKPLANASRRRRDGSFADVNWSTSKSIGARRATEVDRLFEAVWSLWDQAAAANTEVAFDTWRVILPPSPA